MDNLINNINKSHMANVKAHYLMGETSQQSLSRDAVKLLSIIKRQEVNFTGLSDMTVIEEILQDRITHNIEIARKLDDIAREG